MYTEFYDLLQQIIFNGQMTTHTELVTTFLATLSTIAVVVFPFALVWGFVKRWF